MKEYKERIEMIDALIDFGCRHNTPAIVNACIVMLGAIDSELECDNSQPITQGKQLLADALASNMGHGYLSRKASRCLKES